MRRRRRNPGSLEALAGQPLPPAFYRPAPARPKRNPRARGYAKTRALRAAILRAGRSTLPVDTPMGHLGSLHKAYMRRRRLTKRSADVRARRARRYEEHFVRKPGASIQVLEHARRLRAAAARRLRVDNPRRRRRNPGPKGAARSGALGAAILRRHKVIYRRGHMTEAELKRLGASEAAYYRHARVMGRRARRKNAAAAFGLAGLNFVNPRRRRARRRRNPKRGAPMARRRRSAAQRAAFRRMIAGLKRHHARKRNPKKRGKSMARRRHKARRRRAAIVMINPRRHRKHRRRNPSRVRFHRRRRRNPEGGAGVKGAIRSVFMAAIPALGGGFVANFIDAKFLSDKSIVWRILAKLGLAGVAAAMFRRKPVIAYATMGAIVGSIGGDFGTSMGGGAVVGGTPVAKAAGVAALITEDPRAMGVLVQGMRGMGYQIDSNVSLGDMTPLPAGSYQDVNLG